MHEYRLRQIAFVASDLEAITRQLGQVFGLKVAFHDPSVAPFGLINAIFPVGGDFLEVVQPVRADASAARYQTRRGGDAGYMVILQTDDAHYHRRRLEAMGVRRIEILDHGPHVTTQFHPKDFVSVLASIDHMVVPDWRADESDWAPAGPDWRAARSEECLGFASVSLQHADPAGAAARWAELLELPPPRRDRPPALALRGAEIRFVPPRDTDGTGIIGLDIRVREGAAVLRRARAIGLPVEDGAVRLCGVAVRPVETPR
jgi:hypothetical protein